MGSWKGGARTGSRRSGWEVRCRQKWAGLGLQEISWEGDWSVVREGGRPTKWEGDPGSGRETNQPVSGLDAKFSVGKSERCYWLETAVNTETHDMQDLHCRLSSLYVCTQEGVSMILNSNRWNQLCFGHAANPTVQNCGGKTYPYRELPEWIWTQWNI